VAWSRGLELQVQQSWLVEEQTHLNDAQPGESDGITSLSEQDSQSAFPAGT